MRGCIGNIEQLKGAVIEGVVWNQTRDVMALLLDNNRYVQFTANFAPYCDDRLWVDFDPDSHMDAEDMLMTGIISDEEYDELRAEQEVDEQKMIWRRDAAELRRLMNTYPQGVPDVDE